MFASNPYENRKAVTNPSEFYDRSDDISRIIRKIGAGLPQSCSIVGEPRIGKTSFLHYLAHPDGANKRPEVRQYLGDPGAYLFVLIESQSLPTRDALGLWRYVFDRLSEEARKAGQESDEMRTCYERSRRSKDDYEIQMWFEKYLKDVAGKVVLLFDDFEIIVNDFAKADAARSTQKLRALAQSAELQYRLSYIITSTDPLSQLFENAGFDKDPSPLSNILYTEPLGPLDEDGANLLARDPLKKLQTEAPDFTDQDIDFVRRLAGRHPDLIRIACFYLFEAKLQGHVDHDQVQRTIENDSHVRWLVNRLWDRIEEAEDREGIALSNALVTVARKVQSADSDALDELCKRGLVDTSSRPPQVFGDIFRKFILRERVENYHPVAISVPQSIEFEPENRKVKIGSNEQVLTNLEFKLFRYLAENAGRTCAREELQEAVWGDNPPASRDALEQLVRRIRGKVEPDPKRPQYLLAVRGQGYLLRHGATS